MACPEERNIHFDWSVSFFLRASTWFICNFPYSFELRVAISHCSTNVLFILESWGPYECYYLQFCTQEYLHLLFHNGSLCVRKCLSKFGTEKQNCIVHDAIKAPWRIPFPHIIITPPFTRALLHIACGSVNDCRICTMRRVRCDVCRDPTPSSQHLPKPTEKWLSPATQNSPLFVK